MSTAGRSIEAIVFDLDGVLIDSEPIWRAVERNVFAPLGIEFTNEELVETMGLDTREAIHFWYARKPWSGASVHEVVERIIHGVAATITSEGKLMEGARQAIEYAASLDLRVAVASSSPMSVIEAVLLVGDLRGRFEVLVSAEQEIRGKPDPAVYLTAARAMRLAPGRCIALEDTVNGVRAARRAGMTCIALPDPSFTDAHFSEADLVLWSLLEFDDRIWSGTGTTPLPQLGPRL